MANSYTNPDHYKLLKYQPYQVIEDGIKTQGMPAFEAHLWGDIMDYLMRYNLKNGLQDLEKAQVMLGWLIKERRKNEDIS